MPNVDMVNFMMTMMSQMMQRQREMNRMESKLTLPIQTIIEKINKFSGEDITRYLEVYEHEMASRRATGIYMVS